MERKTLLVFASAFIFSPKATIQTALNIRFTKVFVRTAKKLSIWESGAKGMEWEAQLHASG